MPFLIFTSTAAALSRNDTAGAEKGLAYHTGTGITRYPWAIIEEEAGDNRAALEIEENADLLTEEEKAQLVSQLPADWHHPSDA
tara:strand:- start:784 stop:1035 length:252 start_codon:yes stop_codon:yes gene_type:complete